MHELVRLVLKMKPKCNMKTKKVKPEINICFLVAQGGMGDTHYICGTAGAVLTKKDVFFTNFAGVGRERV